MIALAVAVGIAIVVYFVFVIRLGAVSEEELKSMPKGTMLLQIARKCHILKVSAKEKQVQQKTYIAETEEDYWLDD